MEYKQYIESIIISRGQFNIPEGEYFEIHHIIPRCMGGLPARLYKGSKKRLNIDDNLIWLYPSEHYIAHQLLAQENPEVKPLIEAWNIMSHTRDGLHIDSETYDQLMVEYHKLHTGENATFYGKHHSDEYIRKLSERMSGSNNPMFNRVGEKSPRYKVPVSDETRMKMSLAKKDFIPWNKGLKNCLEPTFIRSVINKTTGTIYESVRLAALSVGGNETSLRRCIKAGRPYKNNYFEYMLGGDANND